jgi:hypothetical protein
VPLLDHLNRSTSRNTYPESNFKNNNVLVRVENYKLRFHIQHDPGWNIETGMQK